MTGPVSLKLRSYEFRREREAAWVELEEQVRQIETFGIGALSSEKLIRLPMLYRAALSGLSVARAISLDAALIQYLENLSTRAYLAVYGTRSNLFEALAAFFGERLPVAVRAIAWQVLAATALLIVGGLLGFWAVANDSDAYSTIVPSALAGGRGPDASGPELCETLYASCIGTRPGGAGLVDGSGMGLFAAYLFWNNSSIALGAFALGFLFGVPTVFLLVYNGMVLGAMAQVFVAKGLGWDLAAWLSVHGTTELLAIVLAGAAGMTLARAMILPGEHSRMVELGRRGRDAGVVALGAVALLSVAALLEAFTRQLVQTIELRASVGAAMALIWTAYFCLVGRGGRHVRRA